MPDVTVVVPTRNRVEVLPTTLTAILAQRDVDLEVVVVDEGSSDDTPAYLAGLADERVRVVRHNEPKGLPAARRVGRERSTAPWLAWCDDDDLWAPDKLAAQLAAVRATGCRWAACGALLVDADLQIVGHKAMAHGGDVLEDLLVANVVPGGGSGVVADRGLVEEVGGFDTSLRSSEDWDLWLRLAERSHVAYVDRPLVAYRIWGGSMSTDVDRMRDTRREVLGKVTLLRRERAVADNRYDHDRYLAKQLLRTGSRMAAAKAYLKLAVEHRRPEQLVRAATAAVAPGLMARIGDGRARDMVPPTWVAEGEAWLAPMRVVTAR